MSQTIANSATTPRRQPTFLTFRKFDTLGQSTTSVGGPFLMIRLLIQGSPPPARQVLHGVNRLANQSGRYDPLSRYEIQPDPTIWREAIAAQADAHLRSAADNRVGQRLDVDRGDTGEVRVEQHEVVPPGCSDTLGQRVRLAPVGRVGDHPNVGVAAEQRQGVIGRAVVDHDHLGQGRMVMHRVQNSTDPAGLIVGAHDTGDARSRRSPSVWRSISISTAARAWFSQGSKRSLFGGAVSSDATDDPMPDADTLVGRKSAAGWPAP